VEVIQALRRRASSARNDTATARRARASAVRRQDCAREIGSTSGQRARTTAPADAQRMGETAPRVPVRSTARRARPGCERERASNATTH
jgi:hypothetical protein